MNRPTVAEFHLSALTHNLSVIRQKAQTAFVWAVIKADAYGHHIPAILPAIKEADGFALIELENAIWLRKNGTTKPILLLEGPFSLNDVPFLAKFNITPVIHQITQLDWINENNHLFKEGLTIYLKINTGMNRLGFNLNEYETIKNRIKNISCIKNVLLMTHFSCAHEKNGIEIQLNRFKSISNESKISIANSATLFGWNTLHHQKGLAGDAIRAGIALYGSSPLENVEAKSLNLRPTCTFKAGIIGIQNIKAGEFIGYGNTFKAEKDMRIGVVACGYADGYPRHAVIGTPVWVENCLSCIIGRISMDMLTIDITDCPSAQIGSWVELWGNHVSIDIVAKYCGTISYELMCLITKRVTRIYKD